MFTSSSYVGEKVMTLFNSLVRSWRKCVCFCYILLNQFCYRCLVIVMKIFVVSTNMSVCLCVCVFVVLCIIKRLQKICFNKNV